MSAAITPAELRAWADKRGTLQDDRTLFLAAADALEAAERRVADLSVTAADCFIANYLDGEEAGMVTMSAKNLCAAIRDSVLLALDEVEP